MSSFRIMELKQDFPVYNTLACFNIYTSIYCSKTFCWRAMFWRASQSIIYDFSDSHATGQRPFSWWAVSSLCVCMKLWKSLRALCLCIHRLTVVFYKCVREAKTETLYPDAWRTTISGLRHQLPPTSSKTPSKAKKHTCFYLSTHSLCCSMRNGVLMYSLPEKKKNAKLIILVTIVFIYKHHLFIMKH